MLSTSLDTEQHTGLKAMVLFSAAGLIIISIFCNIAFYSSFADDIVNKNLYRSIGVLFDSSKICIILVASIMLYKLESYIIAGICYTLWLILSLVSLLAAAGFMSIVNQIYEANQLKNSYQFQALQSSYDAKQDKIESLSGYSDQSNLPALNSELSEAQNTLATFLSSNAKNSRGSNAGDVLYRISGNSRNGTPCSSNLKGFYITKYCGQYQTLKANIVKLENELGNFKNYDNLTAASSNTMESIGNLSVSSMNTSIYHPLFQNLSSITDVHPQIIKTRLLGLTAILLEILSSFLIVIFSKLQFQKKK